MTLPTVTWKGFIVIAILCLSAPGAVVYRESMLTFLSQLLDLLGKHAQTIAGLVGL